MCHSRSRLKSPAPLYKVDYNLSYEVYSKKLDPLKKLDLIASFYKVLFIL